MEPNPTIRIELAYGPGKDNPRESCKITARPHNTHYPPSWDGWDWHALELSWRWEEKWVIDAPDVRLSVSSLDPYNLDTAPKTLRKYLVSQRAWQKKWGEKMGPQAHLSLVADLTGAKAFSVCNDIRTWMGRTDYEFEGQRWPVMDLSKAMAYFARVDDWCRQRFEDYREREALERAKERAELATEAAE